MEVTKTKLREWASSLKNAPCGFWACDGPDKPFVWMATCSKCQVVMDIRYHIDGKPRLPIHAGYIKKE